MARKRSETAEVEVGGYLGGDVDDIFWQIMDTTYLDNEDITMGLKLIPKSEKRQEIQRWIQDVRKGEFMDKVNNEPDKEIDPGSNNAFVKDFKNAVQIGYMDMIHEASDPISKMSMLGRRRQAKYEHYIMVNPFVWTSWIEPGADGYIIGVKGSGKTMLAARIAEEFIDRLGGYVVSGVPLEEGVSDKDRRGYIYCNRASLLIETACKLVLEDIKILVLKDESYLYVPGQKPLDPTVIAWSGLGRLSRKLGIADVSISQRLQDIHSDIKKWATFRIRKTSRRHPDWVYADIGCIVDGGTERFRRHVRRYPMPERLKFRTEAVASFRMDFDPGMLYDYLSFLEEGANQFEATIEWLEKKGVGYTYAQKCDLALWLHETCGVPLKLIAEKFNVSVPTVSRMKGKARKAFDVTG